jgi:hypothetical protein
MEAFHNEFPNAGHGYRFFKYAIVGGATLLLPPQWFYYVRDMYAKQELGRLRERFFRMGD